MKSSTLATTLAVSVAKVGRPWVEEGLICRCCYVKGRMAVPPEDFVALNWLCGSLLDADV